MQYKVADRLMPERIGDELVVTLRNGDVAVLNESAAVVLENLCASGKSSGCAAASALVAAFDIDENTADDLGERALRQFRRAGIIEPVRVPLSRRANPCARVTRRAFVAGMTAAGISLLVTPAALGEESAKVANRVFVDDEATTTESVGNEVRVWKDSLGREVIIPGSIKKVAPYGPYAQSLVESIDENMVVQVSSRGLHASVDLNTKSQIEELSSRANDNERLDLMALDEGKPDIILDVATNKDWLDPSIDADANGTPVVHLVVAPGDLSAAYRKLGKILDKSDRCNALADYMAAIDVTLAQVRERVPDGGRKRVYVGRGFAALYPSVHGSLCSSVAASVGAELVGASEKPDDIVPFLKSMGTEWLLLAPNSFVDMESFHAFDEFWECIAVDNGFKKAISPGFSEPWFERNPLLMQTIGALWLADLLYENLFKDKFATIARGFFKLLFKSDYEVDTYFDCKTYIDTLTEPRCQVEIAGGCLSPCVKIVRTSTLVAGIADMSSAAEQVQFKYGIDVDNLHYTETVMRQMANRPYQEIRALVMMIIGKSSPVSDPKGSLPAGLWWESSGTYNGSAGVYELLIDSASNTIVHFLFRTGK